MKTFLILITICLIPILVVGAVNVYIGKYSKKYIHKKGNSPKAHTAIILGAKVYKSGKLSGMLEDRVLTGLELYRKGKVRKLLLTGDHGGKRYDEVNNMRKYLLKKRVAAKDIFMDHAGFSTYDSMYRAREIFHVKDAVVVTQGFHIARAVYIARHLGINATGIIADRRKYKKSSRIKAEIRETAARVKAFLFVHVFKPEPRFLGKSIPITGDGRKTLDGK